MPSRSVEKPAACSDRMTPPPRRVGPRPSAEQRRWSAVGSVPGPLPRLRRIDSQQADDVAREAAALPQASVPVDVRTVHRAAAREARDRVIADWPAGWYRDLMEDRMPPPVTAGDSSEPCTGPDLNNTSTGMERIRPVTAGSAPTSTARRAGATCAARRRTPRATSCSGARSRV